MTHIERNKTVTRRNGKHVATLTFESRGRIRVRFLQGSFAGQEKSMTVKTGKGITPTLNPKKLLAEFIKRMG